jgi:hypothetical protein
MKTTLPLLLIALLPRWRWPRCHCRSDRHPQHHHRGTAPVCRRRRPRPRRPGAVAAAGAADQVHRPAQIAPTPAPKPADKVYDRNGRIVPGVRPAGPNRVFDSRTGRYYDSVPAGRWPADPLAPA